MRIVQAGSFTRSILFAACVAVLSLSGVPAFSQDAGETANQPADANEVEELLQQSPSQAQIQDPQQAEIDHHASQVEGLRVRLEQTSRALLREPISTDDLERIKVELAEISAEAQKLVNEMQPFVTVAERALNEIGPPPEEGATPEAESVTEERARVTERFQARSAVLRNARLLVVRTDESLQQLRIAQQNQFRDRLSARTQSILSPALWGQVVVLLPDIGGGLSLLLRDSFSAIVKRTSTEDAVTFAFGLLVVSGFVLLARRMVAAQLRRFDNIQEPELNQKALRILFIFLLNAVLPILALTGYVMLEQAIGLFNNRFDTLFDSFLSAVSVVLIMNALAGGFLAPRKPQWRIRALEDGAAKRATSAIFFVALMFAADFVFDAFGSVLILPVQFSEASRGVTALLIGLGVLYAVRQISLGQPDDETAVPSANTGEGGLIRWGWIRFVLWIASAIIIVSALAGFIATAAFGVRQMLSFGLAITVLWLLQRLTEVIFVTSLKPGKVINASISKSVGLKPRTLERTGIVLSGITQLFLIFFTLIAVTTPWGFSSVDWFTLVNRLAAGFSFGDIQISPAKLLFAAGLFALIVLLARLFRTWLEKRYLPTTEFDPGLRSSIATIVGYIGFAIAAVISFDYIGLNLENLAIVAGALSVGIGFGLQSIVSNFVSGLILLAERPIRPGDWIVVGEYQGNVRKVNVRATEIETFDRASVIVPNSDLMTGTVKNFTHLNTIGRVIINVGVGYDSDPDEVKEILLKTARDHTGVLAYPEPRVYFLDFGANSLDFSLFAYLSDVNSSLTVQSDLRFEILKALRAAEIDIPFPQRTVTVNWTPGGQPPPINAPLPDPGFRDPDMPVVSKPSVEKP